MRLRQWVGAGLLALSVGCQATAQAVPAPQSNGGAAPSPSAASGTSSISSPVPPTVAVEPAPTAPSVGLSRIEILNVATTAFGNNDLKTASDLYQRVVNTPPPAGEAPAHSALIESFAQFRD